MTYRIIEGHTIDGLKTLEAESVQSCVTSPPYWGLRDYGDSGQEWPEVSFCPVAGLPPITIPAQRAPLGLEPDPWAYVGHMVEVFRAVRRVLRVDGTMWLNLGDNYAANRCYQVPGSKHKDVGNSMGRTVPSGLKEKDLCGIPWRVAYALQADGWYLRSEIIWHKLNPMPESVTDRPTKGHEQVFLFSKGPKYYYDAEAVMEAASPGGRRFNGSPSYASGDRNDAGRKDNRDIDKRNLRTVWSMASKPYPGAHFAVFPPGLPERCIKAGTKIGDLVLDPFSGAGTTGVVALRLQRQYIGTEQNKNYAEQSRRRIDMDAPLFNRARQ